MDQARAERAEAAAGRPQTTDGTHGSDDARSELVQGHPGDDAWSPVLDAMPLAVLVADAAGRGVVANEEWCELLGEGRVEVSGTRWLRCFREDDRARLLEDLMAAAASGGTHVADHRLAGSDRWVRAWIRPFGRDPAHVAVALADVDADHRLRDELEHRATHDALTGLTNRAFCFELTAQALRRRHRHPSLLAVVYIDLDRFKEVNDAWGHVGGDRVLATVGERLARAVRPGDVAARVGGDEFALLCTDLEEPSDVDVIGERVHELLREPFAIGAEQRVIGATLGVALAEDGDTVDTFFSRADERMYAAKRAR